MPCRKVPLVQGQMYHIYTKSIAGFKVFNDHCAYDRMLDLFEYYNHEKVPCCYSLFTKLNGVSAAKNFSQKTDSPPLVHILAYCIMPTHIHLVLQQLSKDAISRFANLILKSYSKHFNEKHNRRGPLWEGRFENVLIKNDEQLLHLTRYIHLNPVTAYLVDKPDAWRYSSFNEYISTGSDGGKICTYDDYLDIEPRQYKEFVYDRISYQRELAKIRDLVLD